MRLGISLGMRMAEQPTCRNEAGMSTVLTT